MARAATEFIWAGTVDTDWTTPGNWVDAAGVAHTEHFPGYDGALSTNVVGDQVLFDRAATHSPSGGDISVYGMLGSLVVGSAYTGTIGTSDTPLTFELDAETSQVTIDAKNAGDLHLYGAGFAPGLGSVTVTESKGTCYLNGLMESLVLTKGIAVIRGEAVVNSFAVCCSQPADVRLTIEAGATMPMVISVVGGTITNYATSYSTICMAGGVWTNAASYTLQLLLQSGGQYNWDAGNIVTARVFGGKLDASRTLTARTGTLIAVYENGTLDSRNAETANWTIQSVGGKILFSPGQKIVPA